jgi:hypothetical protein
VDQLSRGGVRTSILALCLAIGCLQAKAADAPGLNRVFISPSGEPFRPSPASPNGFEAWFARVDTNHDGKIDRTEFRADAAAFFKRIDTNGDGVVDGFEIAAYERTIAPEVTAQNEVAEAGGSWSLAPATLLNEPEPVSGADLELNSKITFAEWMVVTDHRFDLLDKKKLGVLDHEALAASLSKRGKGAKP